MTDVEAVRRRLLVRTERTREGDMSPHVPKGADLDGRRSIKTLHAALLLIKDRVIQEKILEHQSYA